MPILPCVIEFMKNNGYRKYHKLCFYKLLYSTVAVNAEIYHIFYGFKGTDIQFGFPGDLKWISQNNDRLISWSEHA